jgi:hypothetical protein
MSVEDKEKLQSVAEDLEQFLFTTEFHVKDLERETIKLLKSVKDTNALTEYLVQDTDFFTAPASTRFHSNFVGGLALHSMSVTLRLIENVLSITKELQNFNHITYDNVIISALMHDICKTNFYVEVPKWRKDSRGKWESYSGWDVKDQLPIGHGDKSVLILSKYWESNPVVDLAIRWHMGPFTTNNPQDFSNAANAHPLVTLLHTSDFESTYIYEVKSFTLNKYHY